MNAVAANDWHMNFHENTPIFVNYAAQERVEMDEDDVLAALTGAAMVLVVFPVVFAITWWLL